MSTEEIPKIDWEQDENLKGQLSLHEDLRSFPYVDTVGKVSIGIGRNLTDRGLSRDEIDLLYHNDIMMCQIDLDNHLPWWRGMSDNRQRVLLDMCFNLGIVRLLGFHTSLRLMSEGKYEEASRQMLRSKWAKQVKGRASNLSRMMREG
jgi:lysozyme